MSQSTTAARKSGGRADRAASTSSSKSPSRTWVSGAAVRLGIRDSASSASASKRIFALRRGLAGRRVVGDPGLGVVGQRVEADLRLAAGLVEEEVRGDPVQPALEGAGGVGGQRPEDP